MRTRKEVAIKSLINQFNVMQEDFIANKSFSILERMNFINYIDTVKSELGSVLNSKNN